MLGGVDSLEVGDVMDAESGLFLEDVQLFSSETLQLLMRSNFGIGA